MSVRVGLTRVFNITLTEALIALGYAAKGISYFKNWWKTADAFTQYRIIQIPIEILGLASIFGLATVEVTLYSTVNVTIPSPVLALMIGIPAVFLSTKGKNYVLKRLREILILHDPIIAFDCVRCGRRHGALAHSSHPPRKCKACKTRWKDEWADYWKRPLPVVMYMDEVNPGATW
jgi:hypothetical protein